jgi:hypothetical protein
MSTRGRRRWPSMRESPPRRAEPRRGRPATRPPNPRSCADDQGRRALGGPPARRCRAGAAGGGARPAGGGVGAALRLAGHRWGGAAVGRRRGGVARSRASARGPLRLAAQVAGPCIRGARDRRGSGGDPQPSPAAASPPGDPRRGPARGARPSRSGSPRDQRGARRGAARLPSGGFNWPSRSASMSAPTSSARSTPRHRATMPGSLAPWPMPPCSIAGSRSGSPPPPGSATC